MGTVPIPDPTELTSRAVNALRDELTELFDVKLDALSEITKSRFDAVSAKLTIAELLRLEQKVDTKTAVDAALAAQKEQAIQQAAAFSEATTKTERTFSEQLTGLRDTFGTAILAQTTRYDDLKERITVIEAMKSGGQESKASLYAALTVGVTLILAVLTIIAFMATSNGATP